MDCAVLGDAAPRIAGDDDETTKFIADALAKAYVEGIIERRATLAINALLPDIHYLGLSLPWTSSDGARIVVNVNNLAEEGPTTLQCLLEEDAAAAVCARVAVPCISSRPDYDDLYTAVVDCGCAVVVALPISKGGDGDADGSAPGHRSWAAGVLMAGFARGRTVEERSLRVLMKLVALMPAGVSRIARDFLPGVVGDVQICPTRPLAPRGAAHQRKAVDGAAARAGALLPSGADALPLQVLGDYLHLSPRRAPPAPTPEGASGPPPASAPLAGTQRCSSTMAYAQLPGMLSAVQAPAARGAPAAERLAGFASTSALTAALRAREVEDIDKALQDALAVALASMSHASRAAPETPRFAAPRASFEEPAAGKMPQCGGGKWERCGKAADASVGGVFCSSGSNSGLSKSGGAGGALARGSGGRTTLVVADISWFLVTALMLLVLRLSPPYCTAARANLIAAASLLALSPAALLAVAPATYWRVRTGVLLLHSAMLLGLHLWMKEVALASLPPALLAQPLNVASLLGVGQVLLAPTLRLHSRWFLMLQGMYVAAMATMPPRLLAHLWPGTGAPMRVLAGMYVLQCAAVVMSGALHWLLELRLPVLIRRATVARACSSF